MKYLIKHILLCIFVITVYSKYMNAQTPANDPTWELVFVDDFDTMPSKTVWKDCWPWNQTSTMNTWDSVISNDLIGYRYWHSGYGDTIPWFPNCIAEDGILTIQSRNDTVWGKVWNSYDSLNNPIETVMRFYHTTGMLFSENIFRYGYFEIKCKLPEPEWPHATQGIGPAFWLWNGGKDTINYSEIDIFEFAGEYGGNVNHHSCNNHFRECAPGDTNCFGDTIFYDNALPRNNNNPITSIGSVDFSDNNFKKFGMEWSNEAIDYNLDDSTFYTVDNHQNRMLPMHIIVDINTPTAIFNVLYSDTTKWPYDFKIDYVKVWQLKQECSTSVSLCSFDNYDYKVYKDITLGGSGCTPTITNGSNVTLRANDFILLDKGFTVESGAEFQAQIRTCQQQENTAPPPSNNLKPPPAFLEHQKIKYQ